MRKWDYDCSLMCKIQGKIFEKSLTDYESSSSVFIKRYMNSFPAYSMDNENFLNTTLSDIQAINLIKKKFPKPFGKDKYTSDEMYWIGYIYRAWAYIYKMKSKDIVKICTPKEMRELYYPYHSLDPIATINRILEARNIDVETNLFEKTKTLINNHINKEFIDKRKKIPNQ